MISDSADPVSRTNSAAGSCASLQQRWIWDDQRGAHDVFHPTYRPSAGCLAIGTVRMVLKTSQRSSEWCMVLLLGLPNQNKTINSWDIKQWNATWNPAAMRLGRWVLNLIWPFQNMGPFTENSGGMSLGHWACFPTVVSVVNLSSVTTYAIYQL